MGKRNYILIKFSGSCFRKEGKRVNDANDYKTKKFVKKKEKDELQIKGNKKYKKQFDSEQSAGLGKTGMKITTQTPQHTETKSRYNKGKDD